MKVMVMVKATKDTEAGVLPDERILTEMGKYNEELVKAGIMLAGEGLHPSSKGVRVRFSGKDRTTIDGPFAETKELIAGFWMWKVKSMEEAIEWLKRCPNPHEEETEVEIRPVFEADDFGEAFTPELREQEAGIRAQTLGLEKPRFEQGRELWIAGFNERYTRETRMNIPAQWASFSAQHKRIPNRTGQYAYGVCWNYKPDCNFDYLTGVEVTDTEQLPDEFTYLHIPSRRYVVFTHNKHISSLLQTMETIWMKWVPDAGLAIAPSPTFERYPEEFDPHTGMGGLEIWIPLKD